VNSEETRTPGHPGQAFETSWIRVRIPSGESFEKIRALVKEKKHHTVCVEALWPNLGECWGRVNRRPS